MESPGGDPPPSGSDRGGKEQGSGNQIDLVAGLSVVPPSSSVPANVLLPQQQLLPGQATAIQSNVGTAVPLLLRQALDRRLRSNETTLTSLATAHMNPLDQGLVLDASNQQLESLIRLREQERLLASVAATARPSQGSSALNIHAQTELERLLQLTGNSRLFSSLSPQLSPALSQDQQLLLLLQRQRDAALAERNLLAASLRQNFPSQIPLTSHLQASTHPSTEAIAMFPAGTFASVLQSLSPSSLAVGAGQVLTGPNAMTASPETGLRMQDTLASARSPSVEDPVQTWGTRDSTGRKRSERETDASLTQPDDSTGKRKKREYNHESFPVKLHRLLKETEAEGKQDIISFSRHGTEVSVYKASRFENEILPKYFRHNKLSSFRRLLNMYGFERLRNGAEGGTFRHPSFLKDRPDLCSTLERVR